MAYYTKESILAAIAALPVEPEINADALYAGFYKADKVCRVYKVDVCGECVIRWPAGELRHATPEAIALALLHTGFTEPSPAIDFGSDLDDFDED